MLAAVLDLDEGARAPAHARDGRRWHVAGIGDPSHAHVRAIALDERAEQLWQPVLLLIAQNQVDSRHAAKRVRIGLGEAAGDDDERVGVGSNDAPDRLPVGEVGTARDRARVDDVDVGGLALLHGTEAGLLDERAHLL